MRIGLDIMGGDFAPENPVLGAILALEYLTKRDKIVLIGNRDKALEILRRKNVSPHHFDFVHTTEIIGMNEHPTRALPKKRNSSISIGFHLLKEKAIHGFAGAGNTGAMFVGAMFSVKPITGIIRPSLASIVPKENGGVGILLDVGANADCKPDVLYQFAILGSAYAEHVYGIKNPRVGLLNIGEEESKGNLLTQATFDLMNGTDDFHFIGNIEGRDLFNDKADVIVTDGFTGNIVLKEAESFYHLLLRRNFVDEFIKRFNYENYGGSPVLGVNGAVVVGHGISSPEAIKNMILLTKSMAKVKLHKKISKIINEIEL